MRSKDAGGSLIFDHESTAVEDRREPTILWDGSTRTIVEIEAGEFLDQIQFMPVSLVAGYVTAIMLHFSQPNGLRDDLEAHKLFGLLPGAWQNLRMALINYGCLKLIGGRLRPTTSGSVRARRLDSIEWKETRQRIFARDKNICFHCGEHTDNPECDHLRAVSRGGGNQDFNLATSCQKCNQAKSDKPLDGWRR